jgi:hypothetical protein
LSGVTLPIKQADMRYPLIAVRMDFTAGDVPVTPDLLLRLEQAAAERAT